MRIQFRRETIRTTQEIGLQQLADGKGWVCRYIGKDTVWSKLYESRHNLGYGGVERWCFISVSR